MSKKSDRHLRGDAQVTFAVIEQHAGAWPARLMCRVLEVSPSGYYGWRSRPESDRSAANRQLLNDVGKIHAEHHRRCGSSRIHCCPPRTGSNGKSRAGGASDAPSWHPGPGRASIPALHHRQPPQSADRPQPAEATVLCRAAQHRRWRTSPASPPASAGSTWQPSSISPPVRSSAGMREHMRTDLTSAALMRATQRQPPAAGLICHSDRGSQYAT